MTYNIQGNVSHFIWMYGKSENDQNSEEQWELSVCLGRGETGIATVEEKVNQISRILLFFTMPLTIEAEH